MDNFEFSNYSVVYMFLMYQLGDDLHTHGAILSNVTPPNNLLMNLYFENLTVELYVLYVLNMHANRI